MNPSTLNGLLVLDKPGGMTSRTAVDRVLRWFPRRTRVGHTGTLDPLATGVLVMCVGSATRLAEYVTRMGKTYRSTFHLGVRSDTDDADGVLTPVPDAVIPTEADIRQILASFVGLIDQIPPAFSAAKVTGARAYDLARRGAEFQLAARRVRIDGIDVLHYTPPRLDVEVRCGKGTYIRSLARDLGDRLGCGAHVEVLRRTRVGSFTADNALSLDTDSVTARDRLLPASSALAELPTVYLDAIQTTRFRQGQALPWMEAEAVEVCVVGDGTVLGVGRTEGGLLRPDKVLN
jgi:tRNA pseudouridine55 synthase